MPANRGATPNWHPRGDIAHHNLSLAAEPRDFRPASVDDFVNHLLIIGMPEIECYFENREEIARDIANRHFIRSATLSEMIDSFYMSAGQTADQDEDMFNDSRLSA